ncbi:TCP-1/cpn60 chaperonin family protein [Georhizobium profundi]|nr:TCP-1/cpn60 chaperonin family protein [Georhizobium profundi]
MAHDQLLANKRALFVMTVRIDQGFDVRRRLRDGAMQCADAVGVAFGPKGRLMMIDQEPGPLATKSGFEIAQALQLPNPTENVGAALMAQVAEHMERNLGDGTSTAVLLAEALMRATVKRNTMDNDPVALGRAIRDACGVVDTKLLEMSRPIERDDELFNVAYVAVHGDEALALSATEMFMAARATSSGSSRLSPGLPNSGASASLSVELMDIHHVALKNDPTEPCRLCEPLILLLSSSVSHEGILFPYIRHAQSLRRPLLVLTPNIDPALRSSVERYRAAFSAEIAFACLAGNERQRSVWLREIAALTGGTPADREAVVANDIDALGGCHTAVLTRDTLRIVQAPSGALTAGPIQHRFVALGRRGEGTRHDVSSETEVDEGTPDRERKRRLSEAVSSVNAASQHGVLVGGGSSLLQAIDGLRDFGETTPEQKLGREIVSEALRAPATRLIDNASQNGRSTVDALLGDFQTNCGFDASSGIVTDLLKLGVLDATDVVRAALSSASSIAGLMSLTETLVLQEAEHHSKVTYFRL